MLATVAARRECRPIHDYAGQVPEFLDTAYRIQDIAIGKWPEGVAAWKAGRRRGCAGNGQQPRNRADKP